MTWFLFLFSISKGKAVVNSDFPAGRGKGHFLCVSKNGTPGPPEDSSSQEHLFAPFEASPTRVLGIGSSLCKCPAALQYSFPTCPMAATAWECSSQGKLFLGPDMAEPKAANVHQNLAPVQLPELKKKKSPQSIRLSTGSYRGGGKSFFIFIPICCKTKLHLPLFVS